MKHLKMFEEIDEPQIGDYVLINTKTALMADYYRSKVNDINWECKISEIDNSDVDTMYLIRLYKEHPLPRATGRCWLYRDEILYYSKNENDIIDMKKSMKYNL